LFGPGGDPYATFELRQQELDESALSAEPGEQRKIEVIGEAWGSPPKSGHAPDEAEPPLLLFEQSLDARTRLQERVHAE
jgi:hypothetical protein